MHWQVFIEYFKIGGSWWTTAFVLPLILAAIILLFVFRRQIGQFVSEVKSELFKASWPWDPKEKGFKKYKELVDSTVVVIIAMLLLSGYIALLDFVLLNIVGFLTTGSLK